MSEGRHLADTLLAMFAFADHGVLTPFTAAVSGLTAGHAATVPGHGLHSVWALVNHLRFWHEVALLQIRGLPVDWEALGAKDGWPPPNEPPDEGLWQTAVSRTVALNTELAGLVAELTDEELAQPVEGVPISRWQVIQALIVHNSYHTCGIIDTRRILGLWSGKA